MNYELVLVSYLTDLLEYKGQPAMYLILKLN